jgi:hypothetical protein
MVAIRVLESGLARVAALLRRGDRGDVQAALEHLRGLRRTLSARPARKDGVAAQLRLPLALRIGADALVDDCPLGCPVRAIVCVSRQIQSDVETKGAKTTRACRRRADPDRPKELARHDKKRGTHASRPTCVTEHCQVGAVVRALHGDTPEAIAMAARAPRETDTSN